MKKKERCIVFVPGLSDDRIKSVALSQWILQKQGVDTKKICLQQLKETNLEQVSKQFYRELRVLAQKYKKISLVCVSASAPFGIAVLFEQEMPIDRVLIWVGRTRAGHEHSFNPFYRLQNISLVSPAYAQAIAKSDKLTQKLSAQQKQKIVTVNGVFDEVLPVDSQRIPGVKHVTVWGFEHVFNCTILLVFNMIFSKRLRTFLQISQAH